MHRASSQTLPKAPRTRKQYRERQPILSCSRRLAINPDYSGGNRGGRATIKEKGLPVDTMFFFCLLYLAAYICDNKLSNFSRVKLEHSAKGKRKALTPRREREKERERERERKRPRDKVARAGDTCRSIRLWGAKRVLHARKYEREEGGTREDNPPPMLKALPLLALVLLLSVISILQKGSLSSPKGSESSAAGGGDEERERERREAARAGKWLFGRDVTASEINARRARSLLAECYFDSLRHWPFKLPPSHPPLSLIGAIFNKARRAAPLCFECLLSFSLINFLYS